MTRNINEYFHKIYEKDLPKNSFKKHSKIADISTILQIWDKKNKKRKKEKQYKPKYYNFVKKNETPDFAFRRAGGRAGLIMYSKKDIDKSSIQSNYYIKFENFTSEIRKKIDKLDFSEEATNTTHQLSILKQEIIKKLNEIYKEK